MTLFTLITQSWLKPRPGQVWDSQWEYEFPPTFLPTAGTVSFIRNYHRHIPWHADTNSGTVALWHCGTRLQINNVNSRILFGNLSFFIGLMLSSCWSCFISPRWLDVTMLQSFSFFFSNFLHDFLLNFSFQSSNYLHETINNTVVLSGTSFLLACLCWCIGGINFE